MIPGPDLIRTAPWACGHHVVLPPDDGDTITFKFHLPRGTLDPRMSAYELCEFLLPHMPYIVPLLSGNARVRSEFEAMTVLLATSPKAAIDRLLPWVKSVTRTEEDDIVSLNLFEQTPQAVAKPFVDYGAK